MKIEEAPKTETTEQRVETKEIVSEGRRAAVTKAVYVAPVVAGVLFTSKASAQFTPPPPPGG